MCIYPKMIVNPKYKKNKKNGGNVPAPNDPRTIMVPIGCGKCIECVKRKAREWQTRLLEDIKTTQNKYFVTLTFSNESIKQLTENTPIRGYTLDNWIATKATRLFLERWRKKHKKSLKHWLVTELGHNGTENIHIHGIIWFENKDDIMKLDQYWQYGFTWKGTPIEHRGKIIGYTNYVNESTISYITKYVTKTDIKHKYYKPIILTSPGIGSNYTNTRNATNNAYQDEDTNETYRTNTGHKISLPIYYRNKLYTEQQKENLWIQKLNKQTRYVMKQPIDISKNLDHYTNAVKQARMINERLQYGNDQINYDEKKYEETIRKINQETRIQKAKKTPANLAHEAGQKSHIQSWGRTPPNPPSYGTD